MYTTVLKFPDDSVVSSGVDALVAIQSCTYISSVNTGADLTLGSVNASSVQLELIAPGGLFGIPFGSTFELYKRDEVGHETLVGVFNSEQPVKKSANKYSVLAYDNIVKLDKDLTEWLNSLDAWPYRVIDFAQMVAAQCGLTLKNTELLNQDYLIQKFNGQGVTGRKLMEWLGQICAKFCRATPDGSIEFAWYTRKINIEIAPAEYVQEGVPYTVQYNNGNLTIDSPTVSATADSAGNVTTTGLVVVSDDGNGNIVLAVDNGSRTGVPFLMQSLTFSDYETAPIERVRIRTTEDDVGTVYPDVEGNTYDITGNYLLTSLDPAPLRKVAQGIYGVLQLVKYTPCEVSIYSNLNICAGDVIAVTDRNGKKFTMYVMSRTQKGQRDTLSCTGSPRRDSSTSANNMSFQVLNNKMFEVRKSVEGLHIKATELSQQMDTTTEQLNSKIAEVNLKAEGLTASIQSVQQQVLVVEGKADQAATQVVQVEEHLTEIAATASGVVLQVQKILDDGVSKVATGMGYTFDDRGLTIQKPGGAIRNQLDDEGMEVSRSGETMLRADKDGVLATDVTVRNYLIVGNHARFENYNNGTDTQRTACFWID